MRHGTTATTERSSTRTRTLAGALLLAASTVLATAVPADAQQGTQSVAHRGDKQHHPDNSIAGIQSAVDKGADWIEIDVIYNPDGDTLFLSHDNSCSGPGGSAKIDTDSYATVVAKCALPELDDVLASYGDYGTFIVEFKSTSKTLAQGPLKTVSTIEAAGLADTAWISSLTDKALIAARDTGTNISLMRVRNWSAFVKVSNGWLDETKQLGFDSANVNVGAWSNAKVDYAQSLGLIACGWAWPDALEADNDLAINLGLDMFMTDRLDDLISKV